MSRVPRFSQRAQVNPSSDAIGICQNLLHRTRRFPHGDCPQKAGIHE